MAKKGPAYVGLVRERLANVNNIAKISEDAHNDGAEWTITMLNARLDLLEGYWSRFQAAQRQLVMEHSANKAIGATLGDFESSTADGYAMAKAEINRLKAIQEAAAPLPQRPPRVSDVKMPKFGGEYTEWCGWSAEFKVKVYI